ncbi:MAG: hypothetical protein E7427_10215 [Ruminococcaceae bacterium]|jgi:ABC-type Fe3+-hydroxamate transport system substrate-binding protein|nr:hypothetical protein [Oscillospiraceae bacterium]
MAKKKSFFGTLLKLGGLAAAGVAIYSKREEIKSFVTDTVARYLPDDEVSEPDVQEILNAEPDVVIDTTAKAAEAVQAEEDAPEA